MIKGFENITYKLTPKEMSAVSEVVSILSQRIGKKNAIKSSAIIWQVQTINPSRIRMLINYIRRNGLVADLCATSSGYYVAANDEEFNNYLQSLQERIQAQQYVYDCLMNQR